MLLVGTYRVSLVTGHNDMYLEEVLFLMYLSGTSHVSLLSYYTGYVWYVSGWRSVISHISQRPCVPCSCILCTWLDRSCISGILLVEATFLCYLAGTYVLYVSDWYKSCIPLAGTNHVSRVHGWYMCSISCTWLLEAMYLRYLVSTYHVSHVPGWYRPCVRWPMYMVSTCIVSHILIVLGKYKPCISGIWLIHVMCLMYLASTDYVSCVHC